MRTLFVEVTIFKYVDMTRMFSLFYSASCLNSIMFERVIATIRLKSYEQTRISSLSIVLSTVMCCVLGVIGAYCTFTSKWQYSIRWVFLAFIALQISIVLIFAQVIMVSVCFLFVRSRNKAYLRRSKMPNASFSLSQRYQVNKIEVIIEPFR